jgi:hypothetical protein
MNLRFCLPGKYIDLKAELFTMRFSKNYTISVILNEITTPETDSIMGAIAELYRNAGWKRSKPVIGKKLYNHLEPVIEPPHIHYHRSYYLLGFDAKYMENFIRSVIPEFDILDTMLSLCDKYGVHHSKTFPSTRHILLNGEDAVARVDHCFLRRTQIREEEERCCNLRGDVVEGRETFGENPEFNKRPTLTQEERALLRREMSNLRSMDRRENKRRHEDFMERDFSRIIPICILPIFLLHLPRLYHQHNTLLYQCELFETLVWRNFDTSPYALHVSEQISALSHNRRYISFLYQLVHFQREEESMQTYALKLKNNEILFSRINSLLLREADRKIEELLK